MDLPGVELNINSSLLDDKIFMACSAMYYELVLISKQEISTGILISTSMLFRHGIKTVTKTFLIPFW